MDWITGISKAIDYIEEHITEPTDYARAAKEACSSPFNFQRVFALLCGYTLGDYVRMRRLTLAGEELLSTDAKVIDVALKYGYDSPESFSRAFTPASTAYPRPQSERARPSARSPASVLNSF